MTPDPIIGRLRFVDGSVRPVFLDSGGGQYVIDRYGHSRCYGVGPADHDDSPDAPLLVRAVAPTAAP
jgi:hypothetical protein